MINKRLRKIMIKSIEKNLKKYRTSSVLNWITLRLMLSKSPIKHSFCELVAGLSIKNINKEDKKITFVAKRKIVWAFRFITMSYLIEDFSEVMKKRNAELQEKYNCEARLNIKLKFLFYRGDGFINELIEVSDKIYSTLDSKIGLVLGYTYSDVRNLFIYIFQQFYNKMTTLDFSIELEELYKVMDFGKVQKIIKDFSIDSNTNNDFSDNFDYNILAEKPIVIIENKIYVPIVSQLIYNLPKFFHYELLKLNNDHQFGQEAIDLRNLYTQVRGKKLEELVVEYLLRHIDKQYIYHDLKYSNGEADVIIQNKNTTLLFEVKGKLLTLKSYQGDSDSIKTDFQKAIENAYNQAFRTFNHIESNGHFYKENQRNKKIKLNKTQKYYKICITVDNFSIMAIELNKFLTLKKNDSSYPIALNIFDLEYIMGRIDCFEQFIEYLEFRVSNYGFITSIDEIELFEAFMKGIVFEKIPNRIVIVRDMAEKFENERNQIEHLELLKRQVNFD